MRNSSRPLTRTPTVRHRAARRAQTEDDASSALFFRHIGKSFAITLLTAAALLLAASLLAYFLPDPAAYVTPLALTAAALTALIGGFCAARIHGRSALLCGLCNGMLFMGGMILVSLLLRRHAMGYGALESCLLHVGFLLCSVLGGFLGLKKAQPRRKY